VLATVAPTTADAFPAPHAVHVPGPLSRLNEPATHTAHASVAGMRCPVTVTSVKYTGLLLSPFMMYKYRPRTAEVHVTVVSEVSPETGHVSGPAHSVKLSMFM
jgi:hypothetical protein